MATLTETKNAVVQAGSVLSLRDGFGITLNDGGYFLTNHGPNLCYWVVAVDDANLPTLGHPLQRGESRWMPLRANVFIWPDGESGLSRLVISRF